MEKITPNIIHPADILHQMLHTQFPLRLPQGGMFLCQAGSADFVIDLKRFHIQKGDMVVAFPFALIQILEHSDDVDGKLLATDVNFFSSIQISDRSSYYLYIKENPCISLQESEMDKILALHDQLLSENRNVEHSFQREKVECVMKMIVYEVAGIYSKNKPIVQQPHSRNDRIFQQFIFSLFHHLNTHRNIEFYATEQSITARHLSTIVKQMSGSTAGEWIISCTIAQIKAMLAEDKLSIAEISDALNFPNASFFSQYFKKYAGLSPRNFRRGGGR